MKTKKYTKLILIIGIIGFLLVSFYKCPYDYIFGISCPGCGMTRAFIALFHLDIVGAFHFHPLFPIVILVALYLVLEHFKLFALKENSKTICIWILCGLFLSVYFLRLLSSSEIVTFHFEESLLYKIIESLKTFL